MREPLNRHVLEQGANEAGNLEWRVQSEFRAPYEVEMLSRFVYQCAAPAPSPTQHRG